MKRINIVTRRKIIGGIVASSVASLSGCAGFNGNNGETEDTEGFKRVTVEGTELIVEFEEDHTFDAMTVVQPDGELFVEREVATGVRRETVELGVEYVSGEYEVIGVADGEQQSTTTISIVPDIQISKLRLGRNHPEEMYDGASDRRTQMEVIVTLENRGSGPDAVTKLMFDGDIPRPTSDDYEESGIYNTESVTGGHADKIVIPGGDTFTVFSHSTPFNPATDNVSCSPDTEQGEFEVTVQTVVQHGPVSQEYSVAYTGEDLADCEIKIEVMS